MIYQREVKKFSNKLEYNKTEVRYMKYFQKPSFVYAKNVLSIIIYLYEFGEEFGFKFQVNNLSAGVIRLAVGIKRNDQTGYPL